MSDAGDVVSSLYNRLILRDVLGKVVPGSLVLVAAHFACVSEAESPLVTLGHLGDAALGGWVIFVPLGWLAGFALQSAAERFAIIRYYPRKEMKGLLSRWGDCLKAHKWKAWSWWGFFDKQAREDQEEFMAGLIRFQKATKNNGAARQERERLVVIKEACGNAGVAALVVVVLVLLRSWNEQPLGLTALFVLSAAGALFLLAMHYSHVKRQQEWCDVVAPEPEPDCDA